MKEEGEDGRKEEDEEDEEDEEEEEEEEEEEILITSNIRRETGYFRGLPEILRPPSIRCPPCPSLHPLPRRLDFDIGNPPFPHEEEDAEEGNEEEEETQQNNNMEISTIESENVSDTDSNESGITID